MQQRKFTTKTVRWGKGGGKLIAMVRYLGKVEVGGVRGFGWGMGGEVRGVEMWESDVGGWWGNGWVRETRS